jgi:tRNA 2-thiouridine synthesizing protein B
MAMLHTVNKSPFERDSLDACLRMAKSGSSVLLIEDGVLGATKGTAVADKVTKAMGDVAFYALGPDLKARGIAQDQVIDGIKVVDYGGFVDLAAEYDKVQSWL